VAICTRESGFRIALNGLADRTSQPREIAAPTDQAFEPRRPGSPRTASIDVVALVVVAGSNPNTRAIPVREAVARNSVMPDRRGLPFTFEWPRSGEGRRAAPLCSVRQHQDVAICGHAPYREDAGDPMP